MDTTTNYLTNPHKYIKQQIKENLKEFRKSHCFSDVTLLIGRERLACHRIILAAASDFFKAMFSSSMLESTCHSDVNLTDCGVSPTGLHRVIDYIYNLGILDDEIPFEEYGEIFYAADYLQVLPLKQSVIKGIGANICTENALAVHRLAVMHGYPSLASQAWSTIEANTEDVLESGDLENLTEGEMMRLFSDDKLTVSREVHLARGLARWIRGDLDNQDGNNEDREVFAVRELFPLFRLDHVTRAELEALGRGNLFSENVYSTLVQAWKTSLSSGVVTCSRKGTISCIYSVGGLAPVEQNGSVHLIADNKLVAYQSSWARTASAPITSCDGGEDVTTQQLSLSPMATARVYHGTAVWGSWVYVVGGEQEDGMMQASTEAYNHLEKIWSSNQIPDLESARSHLGLVAVEGILWLLGGYTEQGGGLCGPSNHVMMCCPTEESVWTELEGVARMPLPLARMAAVEHEGMIYVLGGVDCFDTAVSSVFLFDPVIHEWSARQSLPRPLHSMAAAVHNDTIFVVGGETDALSFSSEIFAYTVSMNKWTKIGDLCNSLDRPLGRRECSAVILSSKLIVIGGFGDSDYHHHGNHSGHHHLDSSYSNGGYHQAGAYSWNQPIHLLDPETRRIAMVTDHSGEPVVAPARVSAGYFVAPEFFLT